MFPVSVPNLDFGVYGGGFVETLWRFIFPFFLIYFFRVLKFQVEKWWEGERMDFFFGGEGVVVEESTNFNFANFDNL